MYGVSLINSADGQLVSGFTLPALDASKIAAEINKVREIKVNTTLSDFINENC